MALENELKNKRMRCPRLGHEVYFTYCLEESTDLPCTKIISCWQPVLDIEAFLKETLSGDQWQKFTGLPVKDKITNILELIEKAKAIR